MWIYVMIARLVLKIENKNHDFDYVFKIHFYMLINSGHSNLNLFWMKWDEEIKKIKKTLFSSITSLLYSILVLFYLT